MLAAKAVVRFTSIMRKKNTYVLEGRAHEATVAMAPSAPSILAAAAAAAAAAEYAEFQEWRVERVAACKAAAGETALEAPSESSAPAAVVFWPHVVYQCLIVLKEINHITIDESLEVVRPMESIPHRMAKE